MEEKRETSLLAIVDPVHRKEGTQGTGMIGGQEDREGVDNP